MTDVTQHKAIYLDMHCIFIIAFQTNARQAQQAQLGTFWGNQLSPTSLVLCYPKAFVLSMKGDEVLVNGCLPSVSGFASSLCT